MEQKTGTYLITRLKLGATAAGKPKIEMYAGGKDKRYKFAVLSLSEADFTELRDVGIDPAEIGATMYPCRFYADYEESKNCTAKGNPYKDVIALRPYQTPQPQTADRGAVANILAEILVEMRKQTKLLEILTHTSTKKQPWPRPSAKPLVQETSDQGDAPVLNEKQANAEFNRLSGEMVKARKISQGGVGELVKRVAAKQASWGDVLRELRGCK